VLAMLVLFATFVGSFSLTRDDPDQDIEHVDEEFDPPIWEKLKITFRNKPFLSLVAAFFVVNVGLTINSAAALFYYRLRLQFDEAQIRNVLVLFLGVFSLSIPLWVWIGKKWGRKYALIAGALIFGISSCVIYPFLPVGNAIAAYVWASSFGGLVVGAYVLAESILTDVVDYDAVKTHEQNFGFYFGLWKFAAKFSRALALLITGLLLDWANVDFPDPETPQRISLAFGPAVGIFFVLAAVSLIPFGLTEERCAQVKSILRRRSDKNIGKTSSDRPDQMVLSAQTTD
jgi:GPH family glycoside/pentoside/hexuronide:cation symporter